MLLDIEIRGVVEEKTEYRQGDLTGNPVVKYQMRKLVKGSDYVGEPDEVWTEWEDIKIESSSR